MSNLFNIGDRVEFRDDPEKVPYKVTSVSANGLYGEILRTDKYTSAGGCSIPFRVLKALPKVYGPGSLILDNDGDYWLSGPDDLWEYLTIDGSVSDHRVEEGLYFDTTIKQIEQNHGPIRDVYVAPVN